ncbi:MAG: 30S ribosomal protein S6 [Aquificae bacterium]|nr:30S ribosomal protein S6 [Aquificota bacterium]
MELTRHYESVFVLKPTLTEEEMNSFVEDLKKFVTENGGEIYNFEKWGRKELAYPIENFNSGYYYAFNFKTTNTELPVKLEPLYRYNENVIRFLTFKIKPPKEQTAQTTPQKETD